MAIGQSPALVSQPWAEGSARRLTHATKEGSMNAIRTAHSRYARRRDIERWHEQKQLERELKEPTG